jgi:exopolyphosphatase/guanosine-5'-triphosphate,3'-diphosphate pyrophosphatase
MPAGGTPVVGMRVAAIDAGTNTTRLLVAEVQEGDPTPSLAEVERRLIFSRLGEGVDATGRLSPRGIKATTAAISEFVDRSRELGAVRIHIAGTSAVREATNGEELLAAVKEATGLDIEVLTGEAEAALSFAGATGDLPGGRYLVCDIGGGSTELASGCKDETLEGPAAIEGAISLKLGVVRLTERHLAHDPPTPEELESLEADIDRTLQAASEELPEAPLKAPDQKKEAALKAPDQKKEAPLKAPEKSDPPSAGFVGVAGTVTSLAAIKLDLKHYDPKLVHGSELTRDDVAGLYHRLARMSLPEREALPALPPGRADVIVAGCAILSRVMARWSFPAVRVSEKDILDGLALELVERA